MKRALSTSQDAKTVVKRFFDVHLFCFEKEGKGDEPRNNLDRLECQIESKLADPCIERRRIGG